METDATLLSIPVFDFLSRSLSKIKTYASTYFAWADDFAFK